MPVEIVVKQFQMLPMAERVGSVVPSSHIREVLQHFLVQARPGSVTLSATDLGHAMVMTQSASVSGEVEVTLPAKRLQEILKEAPSGEVVISVAEPGSDGQRQVSVSAGGASWELRCLVYEFPPLPDLSGAEFHGTKRAPLLAALRAVRPAVSRDGTNQALACVSISVDGSNAAKVTASDGARFHQAVLEQFPFPARIPAVGSPAAVDEIIRLLGSNENLDQVEVAQTERWLAVRMGSAVFATKPLAARGADVERQILAPALSNNQELTVERELLLAAIRRVRINADASTSAIGLQLGPSSLAVVSQDRTGNTASEQLPAKWEGKERLVVLNHRFLTELLAQCTGSDARFFLGPESKARKPVILVRDEKSGLIGVLSQMAAKLLGY